MLKIEVQLIYHIVLASGVQQGNSAIYTIYNICILSDSFPL